MIDFSGAKRYHHRSMLLIYPPVARSCEPPLGIARLAGMLRAHDVPVLALDLCHEGFEYLLGKEISGSGAWTVGAMKRKERNMAFLRSFDGYAKIDRYRRAVFDLNRVLSAAAGGKESGLEITLSNYRDSALSPLRRRDLLKAAAEHETNVFYPLVKKRLDGVLLSFSTDVIGISINFLSQALCAFAIAGYLKKNYPDMKIILGGGLITSWIRQKTLSCEDNFGGLADKLLPGRVEDTLLDYLGMVRKVSTAAPDFTDFSGNKYFSPVSIIPYNFSSGCPWRRCNFCPENAEKTPYSAISPSSARNEIALLVKRHNPGLIHFTDNELSPRYLADMIQNPPGPPWYGFARFSEELADLDFCLALAASGCRMLQLGLESGDQKVLDSLGKGTDLGGINRILINLREASISVYLYVMFGTPAENHESALLSRDFIESRAALIDFINVAIFNMPAAGEEARSIETESFYEGDLSLYCSFRHPEGWNRNAVRRFLHDEFESSPGIKTILGRNPPIFTSNHASFFGISRKYR